nr:Cytochrome c oxidase assembly protein cox19 [Polyrhizophydium stewartii]
MPHPSWQVFSKATPPERGAFPLDLHGECADIVKQYLACMRSQKGQAVGCRDLTQRYLACRMDKGLMERDSFDNLGFSKEAEAAAAARSGAAPAVPSSPSSSPSSQQTK